MDVPLDSVRPNEDAFFMGHRAAPHGRGGEKVQVAVPRGLRKLCKLLMSGWDGVLVRHNAKFHLISYKSRHL